MVADALHRGHQVRIVDGGVVGVVRVARHPELLPHEDAQRVAELEEVVRFGDAAAPEADEVHARLGRIAQFGPRAFVRRAEHGLRQPVGAADEERPAVDAERARFVRRVGRGGDLPDAEARRDRVAHLTVEFDLQRQVVQFLLPLVQRPPQARVADHELRELLGGEDDLLHLAAVEFHLLLEADALAPDFAAHPCLAPGVLRNVVGIGDLDRDGLARHVVVRPGEFGFDERVFQPDPPGGEDGDVAPDAGVAVADAVEVEEVPSDGHQLGDVAADLAVAAVLEFAVCAERLAALGADRARHVHGIDLHGQDVLPVEGDLVGDVDDALQEHACRVAHHVAVEPDLRTVVDAIGLEPDLFAAALLPVEPEFRPEPVGVEIASHAVEVGNAVLFQFVVQPVVGFGVDAVVDQRVEHRSRDHRRQPPFGREFGRGDLLGAYADLVGTLHLPDEPSSVAVRRGQGVDIFTLFERLLRRCGDRDEEKEKQ